jgi:hypothetical protein
MHFVSKFILGIQQREGYKTECESKYILSKGEGFWQEKYLSWELKGQPLRPTLKGRIQS